MGALLSIAVILLAAAPDPGERASDPPLRVVLTPYRAAPDLLQRYKPLADKLGAELHRRVELHVAKDFSEPVQLLARNEADIAEVTPTGFIDARAAGATPLAMDAMVGRTGTGVVVELGTHPQRALEALKGARFGFVDPKSTSGYLAPYATLRSAGLSPMHDFKSTRFLGSHQDVLLAIQHGTVDAGAVSRFAYDQFLAERKLPATAFRVLVETPRTPGDVYCARPGLEPDLAAAITRVLLALDENKPEDHAILEPISRRRFVPVELAEYARLARIVWSVQEDTKSAPK